MKYLRLVLLPFSLLYGLVIIIRNWGYDAGFFKSEEFDIPIISVGNLEIGGAGKTPMTEYLIRLLKYKYQIATLSRGYGRKTKGFRMATVGSDASAIGDEPAQFKQKFPEVTVAVCERRVLGINELKHNHELIILDDAYQHRAVKPGFSILLFDYNQLSNPHLLLPAGKLREPFSGRWRADVMIASKCPESLTLEQQQKAADRMQPLPFQNLFFTTIKYQALVDLQGSPVEFTIDSNTTVFILTGIANPVPLVNHIKKYTALVRHHNYADHHPFSLKNITKLAGEFSTCVSHKKIIITTEKDAQRLREHELHTIIKDLPIWVMPIGVEFLNHQQVQFDQLIMDYVRKYTTNNSIH